MNTTPRTLFVTNSRDSRKAQELLTNENLLYSAVHVNRASEVGYINIKSLPLLITGEGQWGGLSAITRYARDPGIQRP